MVERVYTDGGIELNTSAIELMGNDLSTPRSDDADLVSPSISEGNLDDDESDKAVELASAAASLPPEFGKPGLVGQETRQINNNGQILSLVCIC